jgi:AraC-like DNA-binding protein
MASSYSEEAPRADLQPWVRLLWRYRDDAPSGAMQRIPPDGCPELIVHLGEPYEEQQADGFVRQPRIIFAGQMTRPLCLRATGPVNCIGLRFEPDGAAGWFGAPMETATDRRLDVSARMAPAEGEFSYLQDAVASVLRSKGWALDRSLRADIRRREAGEPLPDLSATEQRRMQRLYARCVGVSPRILQSVFRFRKVFDHASGADTNWLSAALEAGYFDQPQMARDFRRFLDCTATEWAREQVELARSMAGPRGASHEK